MASEFLSPYQASKVLSGVIKALPLQRPNWLQTFFSAPLTTEKDTVNFDKEFSAKNTMGMFVSPNADVTPIQLRDFGTKELRFAYAKEGLNSDDYEQLNTRQLGQQFGTVDVMANKVLRLNQKLVLAEQRFENLFEKTAADMFLYGGYQAASEKHPTVRYDFGRTVITTAASFLSSVLVPSVNLTTTAVYAPWDSVNAVLPVIGAGGAIASQGDRMWTKAKVLAGTAFPVKDLVKIYETAAARVGSSAIVMSDDAYDVFNYDIVTNYSTAIDTTIRTLLPTSADTIPRAQEYRGLTFRRFWALDNGVNLPIYTYKAVYHDRTTGVETPFIGSGWVLSIPPASSGVKVYGRIMHPRADYAAMPRWINYWQNDKTGVEEWEVHTNFIMGHVDVDACVAWKVI